MKRIVAFAVAAVAATMFAQEAGKPAPAAEKPAAEGKAAPAEREEEYVSILTGKP